METKNYEELYNKMVKTIIEKESYYYKMANELKNNGSEAHHKMALARWRQMYDLANEFGFVDELVRE